MALFRLPMEVRCQIYEFAIGETRELTIGALQVEDAGNHGDPKLAGLPADLQPVLYEGLAGNVLTEAIRLLPNLPPSVQESIKGKSSCDVVSPEPIKSANNSELSAFGLLNTCQQIRQELISLMKLRHGRRRNRAPVLKLNVSYPYGVIVLQNLYPELLRIAKVIHLGGYELADSTPALWEHMRYKSPAEIKTAANANRALEASLAQASSASKATRTKQPLPAMVALHGILETLYPAPLRAPLQSPQYLTIGTFTPSSDQAYALQSPSAPCLLAMQHIQRGSVDSWCWASEDGETWMVRAVPLRAHRCKHHTAPLALSNHWPSWPEGKQDWLGVVYGTHEAEVLPDCGLSIFA